MKRIIHLAQRPRPRPVAAFLAAVGLLLALLSGGSGNPDLPLANAPTGQE